MATHPYPNDNILLPLMHSNLAQILLWWISHIILAQHFPRNILPVLMDLPPVVPTTLHQPSLPSNLAPLHVENTGIIDIQEVHSSSSPPTKFSPISHNAPNPSIPALGPVQQHIPAPQMASYYGYVFRTYNLPFNYIIHWPSGRARGFNPQGYGFISHPVDQYVCTGKSQSLWHRVVG